MLLITERPRLLCAWKPIAMSSFSTSSPTFSRTISGVYAPAESISTTASAPYSCMSPACSTSFPADAMWLISSRPFTRTPIDRSIVICWRVTSASVQCAPTRTSSTPQSRAGLRSRSTLAKPGMESTPSRELRSSAFAARSISASLTAAMPT